MGTGEATRGGTNPKRGNTLWEGSHTQLPWVTEPFGFRNPLGLRNPFRFGNPWKLLRSSCVPFPIWKPKVKLLA